MSHWMLLPQQSACRAGYVSVTLTIARNILRGFALAVPSFLVLRLTKRYSAVALAAMALALAIYYAAWIRFFIGGRSATFSALRSSAYDRHWHSHPSLASSCPRTSLIRGGC